HDNVGVNSRLDAIQAAILGIKLKHLERYTESRREAARTYDALLSDVPGIQTPKWEDNESHVFHQYTLKIEAGRVARDEIRQQLADRGIPSMIYYPVAIHLQGGYTQYGYQEGDFPTSEQLTAEVVSLPMHSELTKEQQIYIVDHLKQIINTLFSEVK
ncbi:MAG: DegT/DnrJ/EryC1/StrS family aminotransferase, partial [Bacteroidota bacterium]